MTKTGEGKRELSPLSPRLPPTSLFLFSSGKGPDSPVGPTSMDRDQQTQSANVSPQKQCLLAHRPTPHPPSPLQPGSLPTFKIPGVTSSSTSSNWENLRTAEACPLLPRSSGPGPRLAKAWPPLTGPSLCVSRRHSILGQTASSQASCGPRRLRGPLVRKGPEAPLRLGGQACRAGWVWAAWDTSRTGDRALWFRADFTLKHLTKIKAELPVLIVGDQGVSQFCKLFLLGALVILYI